MNEKLDKIKINYSDPKLSHFEVRDLWKSVYMLVKIFMIRID